MRGDASSAATDAAASDTITRAFVEGLKVAQLKEELKARGLGVSGLKTQLQERLLEGVHELTRGSSTDLLGVELDAPGARAHSLIVGGIAEAAGVPEGAILTMVNDSQIKLTMTFDEIKAILGAGPFPQVCTFRSGRSAASAGGGRGGGKRGNDGISGGGGGGGGAGGGGCKRSKKASHAPLPPAPSTLLQLVKRGDVDGVAARAMTLAMEETESKSSSSSSSSSSLAQPESFDCRRCALALDDEESRYANIHGMSCGCGVPGCGYICGACVAGTS